MFFDIFIFELKYRFRRPATYMYFGLLLIVGLLLIGTGSTPATEKVYHNSPYVIANLQLIISVFGILIASAIMGVPIYRDIEHKTGTFLFSYPISKGAYFMGRFWGSFVTLMFVSFGVVIGIYLGSLFGPLFNTPAERFGPNVLMNYIQPWFSMVLPNLWFSSALFFMLIIYTRNIRSIYTGGIVFFIIYLLTNFLARDIENKDLVQILDPFGLNSFSYQARYLTPFEKNSFILDVSGNLLINRLLWTGVGVVFFVLAYLRFDFRYFFNQKMKKSKAKKEESETISSLSEPVSVGFGTAYQWKSLWILSKIEANNILKDAYFRSILLGGLIFLILDFWIGDTIYSVPNHPSTSFLMEFKGYDYSIFVFIIIVFFTGEALHRDKSTGYATISDTFPVQNGVLIGSKFFGIALVCLLLATIPVIVGPVIQVLKGYFLFDWSVYFIDCYLISLPDYLQMAMLVFAIHLLVNNKFGGHAASIGVWLVMIVLRSFAEYNFNPFFYSYKPGYIWSDMNGLGHFGEPLFWFNLYWTLFGLFLILFFSITYVRGTEFNLKTRLKQAKGRLFKGAALVSYVSLVAAILVGVFIFKNVVYTNGYLTNKELEIRQAEYEKQLKASYQGIPQPKVIDIKLKADVYPRDRDMYAYADMTLVNKTDSPIDSLHFSETSLSYFHAIYQGDTLDYRFPLEYDKPVMQLWGKKPEKHWYKIYALPNQLQPGDTLTLQLATAVINKGFPNDGYGREVVYNGTFLGGALPSIGYNEGAELSSDEKRKKYDLPEKEFELPPHDDPYGNETMLFNDDADLISFEAVISTDKGQIAIAPGNLVKEWEEEDRKFYQYKEDTKIDYFFNIVSADYTVIEDEVAINDSIDIRLQVFHHPTHDYNIDRFMSAFKDGLVYFSDSYGTFQFDQMRLLEFPRYASFAQSFPNTVPYAESFGWVADFSDPNDFDYGYFVTAHELAHQWWGHQVVPNYTRGSNLISESLAEYTALILTEKRYGKDNMERFLKQELDRYLSGRSNENKKENLYIDCNRAYQWYYKGSLILYGLRDYVGDSVMNTAIRNFRDEFALKEEPPFAGSDDLYRHFEQVIPDSLKYYLEDTWKKLTLYENKVETADAIKTEDGKYEITLSVSSQKVYADSLGMESPAEYAGDYIDIAVFDTDTTNAEGRKVVRPLYIQKHKLSPGQHEIKITVDKEPDKAGIDPYHKLIDRRPEDNVKDVSI